MAKKVQELFDNPEHDDYVDEDLEYIKSSKKQQEDEEESEESLFDEDEDDYEE